MNWFGSIRHSKQDSEVFVTAVQPSSVVRIRESPARIRTFNNCAHENGLSIKTNGDREYAKLQSFLIGTLFADVDECRFASPVPNLQPIPCLTPIRRQTKRLLPKKAQQRIKNLHGGPAQVMWLRRKPKTELRDFK